MAWSVKFNSAQLTAAELQTLVNWLLSSSGSTQALQGRERWMRLDRASGAAHVKICSTGGALSKLPFPIRCSLGARKLRRELKALQLAQKFDISSPKLLGGVMIQFRLWRVGLVVTHFEEGDTLASVSSTNPNLAKECFENLRIQLDKLTEARLFHKDLHPGNVLVKPSGDVVILDWASVIPVLIKPINYRERYINRWRRACIKYNLPRFLISYFCSIMTKLSEDESLY